MRSKQTSNCTEMAMQKTSNKFITAIKKHYFLYLLLIPGMIIYVYFHYLPMPGAIMAFMDYDLFAGYKSPWVGWDNFVQIFTLPEFTKSIVNTIFLSFLNILVTQPAPMIFALLLNEIRSKYFKRVVQSISYLPHFLSYVAVIGIAYSVYSTYGIINDVRVMLLGEGAERIKFLASQSFFVPNFLILNLWKETGWGSILYLAAITGIDPQLYEAAHVDGANRFKQCLYITIPSILPTMIILLIMASGNILRDNFDLVYGLQNAFIDFETISTVVFKEGITAGNYSMATALGLFQGVVGFVLVSLTNSLSKKINDVALW